MTNPEINNGPAPTAEAIAIQPENGILQNMRRFGLPALALTAALAMAKAPAVFAQEPGPQSPATPAQEDKDYASDAWPAIDQVIDGVEFGGRVSAEQANADYCKSDQGLYGIYSAKLKMSKKQNDVAKIRYNIDDLSECNGYGRRTIKVLAETKRPGHKKFKSSDPFVIKSHLADETTKSVKLAQACNTSTGLIGRVVTKVSYEHMDGSVQKQTYKTSSSKLSCK